MSAAGTTPVAASARDTILFAGGGSGGHIFPGVAIAERLERLSPAISKHFLISQRPIDARLLEQEGLTFTALPVQPLSRHPWQWPPFLAAWSISVARVKQLLRQRRVRAVVTTGGFVSGPAVVAAHRQGVPVVLVNLDAVPGKANRFSVRRATKLFSVYDGLPGAQCVGMPLRRSALALANPQQARQALGLSPDRPTLLITGGSQGAQSINRTMEHLIRREEVRRVLIDWQVFHLAGTTEQCSRLISAYRTAGIPGRVEAFWNRMGDAWGAATVAISRAGAGGVAEAWANATPTIFLPYPHHRDQHQRHNAEELANLGGALICDDPDDPAAGADRLAGPLTELLQNAANRADMVQVMRAHQRPDGALVIAQWLVEQVFCAADRLGAGQ